MVKKIKIILVFLVLGLFIKCGEETLNVSRSQRAEEVGTGIIEEVVDKKGIGMSSKQITWSTRVGQLKPFWYYAWNRDLKENIPDSVEFVPMFWGASSVTDDAIENMKALADAGKVKYILSLIHI